MIDTEQYRHNDRHMDKLNQIESIEIKSCNYSQFIFDTHAKIIPWEKSFQLYAVMTRYPPVKEQSGTLTPPYPEFTQNV